MIYVWHNDLDLSIFNKGIFNHKPSNKIFIEFINDIV